MMFTDDTSIEDLELAMEQWLLKTLSPGSAGPNLFGQRQIQLLCRETAIT